jgi:hypothetical protein
LLAPPVAFLCCPDRPARCGARRGAGPEPVPEPILRSVGACHAGPARTHHRGHRPPSGRGTRQHPAQPWRRSYAVSQDAIKALPGGANQQFNQILLQIPGVSQDGGGQFHVRDDHANLQYRINGTILPEGLAVFGQTLSPRLIDHFALLTGALPAQYGLRTAGIMDITTKSGLFAKGGQVSLYGGSHGSINPSFDYGGSSGDTNYFVSGDFKHNNLGIESVDGSSTPLHDKTDQAQGFAYVDHIVDPDNRISFLGGFANQHFQIPNPRGLSAAQTGPGYSVGGQSDYLSNNLNEQQLERTGFGQLAWLRHTGALTLQTSVSARYSELIYRPDVRRRAAVQRHGAECL